MRNLLHWLLLLCVGAGWARAQEPQRLRLALAANLQPVFPALKAAFERGHPNLRMEASFGATGSLHTQIVNGAPFDIFLSADEATPRGLSEAGLGLEQPFPYAKGVLVLWVPKDSPVPIESGLKALTAPGVRLIALANPKLAPYGAAAEATLNDAGLLETLRPKLVQAENIGQAAQYAYTGVVDIGFVALSQVHSNALRGAGRYWEVPAKAHPPILQFGLILAKSREPAAAKAFREFILGAEAQAILRASGYVSPR